jgi:cytochrome c-type biogenesis protein CcmH/NrfG
MHSFDHRRCPACGELRIVAMQRFIGGWFFIRCPNCRRQLRVDPQHGQRWILLVALALIGAAAIAGAAVTDHTGALVAAGALACALLYIWEFALTRHSPLEAVTREEARGYRRNWVLTAVATLFATCAVVYAATQI